MHGTGAAARGGTIEIRVHGMGDHHDGSALGALPIVADRSPGMPDTAVPPAIPDHPVMLMNWSRTSRRSMRLLWYLALPFTLINLMGYMRPRDGRVAPAVLRVSVVLMGQVLTVTATVWLIAIGETVLRSIPRTDQWPWLGEANVLLVAIVLAATVIRRWRRGVAVLEDDVLRTKIADHRIAWLHATSLLTLGVVIAIGAVALWNPPRGWIIESPFLGVQTPATAQVARQIAEDFEGLPQSAAYCEAFSTGAYRFTNQLDALNAIVLIGGVITGLIWLALITTGSVLRKSGALGPLGGAAFAAVLALALLNGVGAMLRLGIGWVLDYVMTFVPVPGRMSFYERHVMAFQGQRIDACEIDPLGFRYNGTYYLDAFPLVAVLGALAAVMALLIVHVRGYRRLEQGQSDHAYPRYVHLAIERLGSWLVPVMILAGVLWGAMTLLVWYLIDAHLDPWSDYLSNAVRFFALVSAIFIVLFVLLGGRFTTVRRVLATVADIAGFWNTRFHPLAGDSYRFRVINGLHDELRRHAEAAPIVLVGHSQGSVICAWFVAKEPHRRVALLTCGSPLQSLYATFFPSYFDDEFFGAVERNSTAWVNTWRDTDPIAVPIRRTGTRMATGEPSSAVSNEQLPDPRPPSMKTRGHSDYWTDPRQAEIVSELARRDVEDPSHGHTVPISTLPPG